MPVELIVATFDDDETKAATYLKEFTHVMDPDVYGILAAAAVGRSEHDKVHVEEFAHHQHGGTYGALAGATAGVLLGPLGIVAGGVIGGVAGHVLGRNKDVSIPKEVEKHAKKDLEPGTSVLFIYADQGFVDPLTREFENLGASVEHDVVPDLDIPSGK